MRYLILSCALLCAGISFSQSKKKQIESLEHQLDSVTQLNIDLNNLNIKSENQVEELKTENVALRKIIKGYVIEIDKLVTLNLKLEKDFENAKEKEKEEEPELENIQRSPQINHLGDGRGNPFGSGGSGGGQGNGEGGGFGSDSGNRSRPRTVIRNDDSRVRQNNVNIGNITVANDATINYRLTVDADGNVVAFSLAGIRDISLDETLVNTVGEAIKKQVKYNKAEGAPFIYQYYTIHIKRT